MTVVTGAAMNLYGLYQEFQDPKASIKVEHVTTAISTLCDAVTEVASFTKAVPWVIVGKSCSFISGRIGLSYGDVAINGGNPIPIVTALDNINAGKSPTGYSLAGNGITVTDTLEVIATKNFDGTFTEVHVPLQNGVVPKGTSPVSYTYSKTGELLSMQYSGKTTNFVEPSRSTAVAGLSASTMVVAEDTQATATNGKTTTVTALNDQGEITGCYDIYVIQRNDTALQIEAKFGMPSGALKKLNPDITNENLIYVGQQVCVRAEITNQNQSNAPTGITVGANQFFVDGVFSDPSLIGFATGFTSDAIKAANPGVNFGLPLAFGTVLNLPAPTNTLTLTTHISTTPTGTSTPDATASISADNSTLGTTGDYTFGSGLGNVNTSSGLQAVANDLIADDLRPGNFNLTLGSPTDFFSTYTGPSLSDSLNVSLFNTGVNDLRSWLPTDPLVLDLNGDGVKLTNFTDAPVLFDADNDGGSKEQTGWVSAQDGIVVHDLNRDGQINNIAETLSEYYKGTAGSNGMAGTKPYANGFEALKSLDTGNGTAGSQGHGDGIFDSRDAAWANLRVWVDANHDGKSWGDTNNNGLKEATETTTELKTFAELGITQINLSSTSQSGEVRDGNEVLARGTFVQNGVTIKEAVAANFLNNPTGSTLTRTSEGVTATLEGSAATKSYASGNTSSTKHEALSTSTLGVQNLTGGAGNDTLTGDAQGNWLAGGLGVDVFNAGAGDDIILADAKDLANAVAINGGDGLDMVQVIGSEGVSLNMAASKVEIAVGNIGNDVIIGGGGTSVFVRGGDGDDVIVGGAANDALSGENGDDYIDGGAGNDIIRGHRGQDQLSGGSGDDLIEGGLEDDRLSGGLGNDVLKGGSGDDLIAGGDGTDVAQYSGSYADYRVTQLNDSTWRVVDTKSGRDGADVLTHVERLSFADVSQVKLGELNALPVADVLTKDGANNVLSRTGSYYIAKSQLLGNDRSWQGAALSISAVLEAKGGTATLVTAANDPHVGDILFTPDASYKGVMSFKYQVKDAQNNIVSKVINPTTGAEEQMKATVYLRTPDLPTDPLALQQWYLSDACIIPVWKDYTGKGVSIGQFEPGGPYSSGPEVFDYRHADLQANVDKAWLNDAANPVPQAFSNHGTEVAGVMVAARNGEGVVGVAYDAELAGHHVPDHLTDTAGSGQIADELNWQMLKYKNYDIVNNSWGISPDSIFAPAAGEGVLTTGMREAISVGRNGLGTAIVFSAGNGREVGSNTSHNVLISNHAVITVGAINAATDIGALQLGQKPFSTPGASILVSAAGSNIKSAARELIGANGSVFGGDAGFSEGTSLAAPIVSGIIALMLEANPKLGYRDIQTILAMSATKFNDPNGTDWVENKATNWNGGGMHVSHDYGFGKVDARAAVRLAETWRVQDTLANMSHFTATSSASLNGPLPDGSGSYSSSLSIDAGVQVESAQVTVQLDHQRLGDLIIKLISPGGTESILMNRPGKAPGSGDADKGHLFAGDGIYSFNTTHVRGEQSGGQWRLQVFDAAQGSVGTLKNWSLDVYGSARIENTYVYTDEYATSAGAQRGTLSDTNGGSDVINAAAVTANSIIDLRSGNTSTIAGRSLIVGAGIEAAVGGDGDDKLIGNSDSNPLVGGRGNDSLYGQDGNDELDAGAGQNSISGGSGNDVFVIRKNAGAVDTITDFSANGIEKIAVVGFAGLSSFEGLTIQAEGVDTRINLADGQGIVLKNTAMTALSEQNFMFLANADTLSQYTNALASPEFYAAEGIFTQGNDAFDLTPHANSAVFALAGDDAALLSDGRDFFDGGNGNDYVEGDTANGVGNDWLEGGAGNDVLKGAGGADTLRGGGGDDALYGGDGIDVLLGSAGNDYLDGGAGDDVLMMEGDYGTIAVGNPPAWSYYGTRAGGAGADTFKFSTTSLGYASYNTADPKYLAAHNLIADFDVAQSGELIDLTAFEWISGLSDLTLSSIVFNQKASTLVNATNGADKVFFALYGIAPSALNASHFKFALNPGFLGGTGSGDSLTGNAGANTLDGRGGADAMEGRTGDDTYIIDNDADVIKELPGGGFDIAQSDRTYTLSSNVEGLTLTGTANINATGNAERNRIHGNSGDNRLDGGAEADELYGGAGNDTYVVDTQLDTVVENRDEDTDTVESSVSWGLSENVENLILTGTATIHATGNALNNVLKGNASDNILDGVDGADSMEGGLGNDTYYIDNSGDVVTEAADAGIDSVYVNTTYTTGGNIENAALYGNAAANLTGNTLNNSLIGNKTNNTLKGLAGDDMLDGGMGADTMEGGAGHDTYVVDNAADVVTELAGEGTDTVIVDGLAAYTLGAQIENGSLARVGSLTGNALANALTGSNGADSLVGGGGADTLNGGFGGGDTLVGGMGDDTYIIDDDDAVSEVAGEGVDTFSVWMNNAKLATNVENMLLVSAAALVATGNDGANRITGNAWNNTLYGLAGIDTLLGEQGDDTLDGGAGADSMEGGGGNDIYYVDNMADVVVEQANAGLDEVYASGTYTVGDHIEYAELTGNANINLTGGNLGAQLWGNAGNNRITGGLGDDELSGSFGGMDTLVGGKGNDFYYVFNASDTVIELAGEGADDSVHTLVSGYRLAANVENLTLINTAVVGYGHDGGNSMAGDAVGNTLYGLGGDDAIAGFAGNDTLIGGLGDDFLAAGTGDDTYIYNPGDGYDIVSNYDKSGVDTLLLHGVNETQVWFTMYGKDLSVSIIGVDGEVYVSNWGRSATYQIDSIKLDSGKTLSAAKVGNLVAAMAAFTPPAVGQTALPTSYQSALNPVIAANWA